MHRHLPRLERVWIDRPIYFVTTCTSKPWPILTSIEVADILVAEVENCPFPSRLGCWAVRDYA